MKKHLPILMLGACLALDGQAQSFGDLFKSAVTETAKNIVTNSAAKALTPNAAPADNGAAPAADPLAAMAGGAAQPAGCGKSKYKKNFAAPGPRPESFEPAILWPENTQCPAYKFSDLGFEKAKAAKTAFREASKVRCSDCEGGYSFDAWGGRSLIKPGGDYSKDFPKLLVALEQGKSVGWKGEKYNVTITAIGEQPIGETPCKQFRYTLTQAGKTVSEYHGMYCKYLEGYSAEPTWNEVL